LRRMGVLRNILTLLNITKGWALEIPGRRSAELKGVHG
jgi:hypothetical protein